ncbi:MAG: FxsA family protein [Elusimicrobiota bacterium]|nr:FxsA family protein [Elusimicrobiota bacterium]
MLGWLILLFTGLPLIELYLLLVVGREIGVLYTLAIVVLTGVAGAALARREGLMVLKAIQDDLNMGIMPGDKLIDGFLILAGGITLLTPGLLTDTAGFLVLIPFTRKRIKALLKNLFRNKIETGNFIGHL